MTIALEATGERPRAYRLSANLAPTPLTHNHSARSEVRRPHPDPASPIPKAVPEKGASIPRTRTQTKKQSPSHPPPPFPKSNPRHRSHPAVRERPRVTRPPRFPPGIAFLCSPPIASESVRPLVITDQTSKFPPPTPGTQLSRLPAASPAPCLSPTPYTHVSDPLSTAAPRLQAHSSLQTHLPPSFPDPAGKTIDPPLAPTRSLRTDLC